MYVGVFCSIPSDHFVIPRSSANRMNLAFCYLLALGPVLLGAGVGDHNESILHEEPKAPWRDLPAHPEEVQVERDVSRSFIFYPKCKTSLCSTCELCDIYWTGLC